jgi:hypothetical protein
MTDTSIVTEGHPGADAFAFAEPSRLGRVRDRLRGGGVETATVVDDDPSPRPAIVEVGAKTAKTITIVVVVIVGSVLALAGALFGFAGVTSLLTR